MTLFGRSRPGRRSAGCWSPTTAPGSAASPRNRTSAPSKACSRRRWARCCATSVALDVRGPHRRRRARVGSGRVVRRRRRGSSPTGSQASLNGMLGPEIVVRDGGAGSRRLRRPPLGALARVPLHDREPPGARSVPGPLRVVGRQQPLELRGAAARGRPVRRRARLLVVLPHAPTGEVSLVPAGVRVALARPRRRHPALRGAGQRVLLADGAVDRRHDGRGRASASAGPAT